MYVLLIVFLSALQLVPSPWALQHPRHPKDEKEFNPVDFNGKKIMAMYPAEEGCERAWDDNDQVDPIYHFFIHKTPCLYKPPKFCHGFKCTPWPPYFKTTTAGRKTTEAAVTTATAKISTGAATSTGTSGTARKSSTGHASIEFVSASTRTRETTSGMSSITPSRSLSLTTIPGKFSTERTSTEVIRASTKTMKTTAKASKTTWPRKSSLKTTSVMSSTRSTFPDAVSSSTKTRITPETSTLTPSIKSSLRGTSGKSSTGGTATGAIRASTNTRKTTSGMSTISPSRKLSPTTIPEFTAAQTSSIPKTSTVSSSSVKTRPIVPAVSTQATTSSVLAKTGTSGMAKSAKTTTHVSTATALKMRSTETSSSGIYFSVQPPYRNGSNQADAQADHSELSAPEGKQPIQQNQPMSQALPKFEIQEEKRPVANFKRKGIKNAPPFAKIPEESPHRRFHMLPSSQQPQQSVESFNGRQPNVGFNSKEGGDFFPVNKVPEKRQPIPVQASHVRKQLMQSTSKPSTEKLASHVVIWTSGQYLGAPNSDENVTNTESPCACSLREAWMDIVFALDVSDAISIQDLHALTNFLSHLAKIMRVEQGVEKSTRFAIVKFAEKASIVADFGMIVNSEVFGRKMEQIAFLHGRNNSEAGPGKVANIAAGLVAAQRLLSTQKRRNVPGVVVLFSSTDVECIKSGTSSRKRWAKTFDEDPCRVATRIKQGNNVLITVAMRFGHALTYPKMNISTPCFHAQNSRNLSSVLKKMLCQANCFCLPPFVQFTDEDQCKRSGECVYTQSFAASFTQASKTCSDYGAHLVEIFSPAKESFIRDLHLATKNIPYWIGISSNLLKPQWNSGKKVYATDYSNWDPQTKGLIEGQCAYADLLSNSEKNVVWRAEQCEDFETSYYFSCQKSACDTSQYCEINDHRPI